MTMNLLILGGTLEARALCARVAELGLTATLSLAGRVARPKASALPVRSGGFGGVAGLRSYLLAEKISHVIDATHPFAAQMSRHAITACAGTGVPLLALTRAPWQAESGDHWLHVPDMEGAVAALDRPPLRVMLAVGRMHLAEFARQPQHHYLLRLVDPPDRPMPLPHADVIIDRGPFDVEADTRLMQELGIQMVVSKNAGGTGAVAKITAARHLGLQVVMIDRPALPQRREVYDVEAALDWLHTGTDLGV